MPKLYHQAMGWTVPGKQDRNATRVDIPSNPELLAAWLNEREVPPHRTTGVVQVEDFTGYQQLADERRYHEQLGGSAETFEEIAKIETAKRAKVEGHCDACGRSADGALKLARGNELDAIDGWLETFGHSDLWALQALVDRVRAKAAELKGSIQ
jgi:hypothetical protein